MIRKVMLRSYAPNSIPHKFEAGTPAVAEAVGLSAAVDYLKPIGMDAIAAHEHEIVSYALEQLNQIPGVRILGPDADRKGGVVSFTLDIAHPHDVAQILDRHGIAVRAGHHCAMPLHDRYQIPATTRASFYIYSTREEVDHLVQGLEQVKAIFG